MSLRRTPRIVAAATAYRSLAATAAEVADADTTPADPGAVPLSRWAGPIAFEGQITGDGRTIQPGALTWPDTLGEAEPLPFRTVIEDVGAHDNAVTTGRIFSLERLTVAEASARLAALGRPAIDTPDTVRVIWGEGDFDIAGDAGAEAARLVAERLQTGVSIDLDDVVFEVRVASDLLADETESEDEGVILLASAGDDPDANGRGYEVVFEARPDDEIMVTTSARIRSATQVAIPAFAFALISLVEAVEAVALAAAAGDAAEPATGAIVALLPAEGDPIAAASSQLAHVTLAYLGEAADFDDAAVDAMLARVRELAGQFAPIEAVPESRGTLGESEADVVYVRSDGLDELHDDVSSDDGPIVDRSEYGWNPHVTLGYPDEPARADYDPDEHDVVRFDRIGLWIGERREDFPLDGSADGDDAGDGDTPESLEAGAAPIEPPREWFADPQLDGPTPLRIDADGRVYGHLATWDVCHIASPGGEGVCVVAPRSGLGYARFHTGTTLTSGGEVIDTGRLTMGTGHAGPRASAAAAAAHYDHTGTAVADVRAGEDAHGIWVAGALRPDVTPEQIRTLRASPLSGDWRRDEHTRELELRAALAVNVPGFPIPRPLGMVASGELSSLVASGIVVDDATVDALTEPGTLALSDSDAAYLARLIEREKRAEAATLASRVAASRAAFNRRKVAAFTRRR